MSNLADRHIERLRAKVLKRFTAKDIPEWLTEHTFLEGLPFSFKNHEYQEKIARDDSVEKVIKKCSQVGISELSLRESLALVNIIPGFVIAYTLPTAGFASTFSKTRVDPVIQSSRYLSDALDKRVDNSEVKRFSDSYIYFKGCSSSNAPISIPCSMLVHDEVDFSSEEVMSQYESRLTHSKWKRKTRLSTPTLPDFGIDMHFKASRRHFNFVKCNHCNHQFVPDYYRDVHIPGYFGSLADIRKHTLTAIRWKEAAMHCPKCHGVPSLQPEHREWVVENTDENYVAAGYQVSPFDAPNIVSTPELVKTSTNYARQQDFVNYALGQAMEDKQATFTAEELNALFVDIDVAAHTYVIGLDLGMTCHLVVGAIPANGGLFVVHAEKIPVGELRARLPKISLQWNTSVIVSDSQPYTESIISMQVNMTNLWGAVYTKSKSVEIFSVKLQEEDEKKGRELVRQVNINRDKAFDSYMADVRAGLVAFKNCEMKQEIINHHLDMKRMKVFDDSNEIMYTWKKSTVGEDHFHHAMCYLYIAARLKGTAHISSISSFSIKTFALPEKVLNPVDAAWAAKRGWGK